MTRNPPLCLRRTPPRDPDAARPHLPPSWPLAARVSAFAFLAIPFGPSLVLLLVHGWPDTAGGHAFVATSLLLAIAASVAAVVWTRRFDRQLLATFERGACCDGKTWLAGHGRKAHVRLRFDEPGGRTREAVLGKGLDARATWPGPEAPVLWHPDTPDRAAIVTRQGWLVSVPLEPEADTEGSST